MLHYQSVVSALTQVNIEFSLEISGSSFLSVTYLLSLTKSFNLSAALKSDPSFSFPLPLLKLRVSQNSSFQHSCNSLRTNVLASIFPFSPTSSLLDNLCFTLLTSGFSYCLTLVWLWVHVGLKCVPIGCRIKVQVPQVSRALSDVTSLSSQFWHSPSHRYQLHLLAVYFVRDAVFHTHSPPPPDFCGGTPF